MVSTLWSPKCDVSDKSVHMDQGGEIGGYPAVVGQFVAAIYIF